jgi:hypothetical protein
MDDAKLVTSEYARQIIEATKQDIDEASATYLVIELLKEYGAKAYRQGREHLAAEVAKLV